jgi:hypothetical protein
MDKFRAWIKVTVRVIVRFKAMARVKFMFKVGLGIDLMLELGFG